MAENVVKQLTGGDTIAARFLYQDFFEFEPQFKLWLGTNHKPSNSRSGCRYLAEDQAHPL